MIPPQLINYKKIKNKMPHMPFNPIVKLFNIKNIKVFFYCVTKNKITEKPPIVS